MDIVELARLQFALTSIYHFLFVPVTIGLVFLVALLHTGWHRKGDEVLRRMARFFGVLLIVNVGIGVVSGLVQEFQFGMNWSVYSRFVGDVFGAPLAIEGLGAFFLEATFLGLWIFGWGRLPKRIHLATIWAAVAGALLSAAFIMAANSWMQNPVGYQINEQTGNVELTDFWALLTNPVFLMGYVHVVLASLITGAMVMLAVSAWHLRRKPEARTFGRTAKLSAAVLLLPAILLNVLIGSELGVVEAKYQPMKIAAAEAQWETCQPCSFSMFQTGGSSPEPPPTKVIQIPHLLSLLATNSWNGEVVGMTELNEQYQEEYGPGNYVPNVFIQYWSMRVMAYLAMAVVLLALSAAWLSWRGRLETSKWFLRAAMWAIPLPFVMNTAGWMLTENGRQPWIVQGLLKTEDAVSPTLSTGSPVFSLVVYIGLYVALAIVAWMLMFRYARRELEPEAVDGDDSLNPVTTY